MSAEKRRADHVLPIDLWKMDTHLKENVIIERPQLVEKFIDDLQISRYIMNIHVYVRGRGARAYSQISRGTLISYAF